MSGPFPVFASVPPLSSGPVHRHVDNSHASSTFATLLRPSVSGVRARQTAGFDTETGERSQLTFDLALDPASLGTRAQASAALERALAPELSRVPFVITGPVTLTVTCPAVLSPWHPDAVDYPNLQTWLWPLIDALSGADRLLVSPALVGAVHITTRNAREDFDGLSLTLAYPSRRVLEKTPLRTVAS
jgi:hypothetical protein